MNRNVRHNVNNSKRKKFFFNCLLYQNEMFKNKNPKLKLAKKYRNCDERERKIALSDKTKSILSVNSMHKKLTFKKHLPINKNNTGPQYKKMFVR